MANIKSAKKRIKVISKKTALNKSRRSALKTAEKRFFEAIEAGDKAVATVKFNEVQKQAMQAAKRNIIHKNAASRKVARLSKKLSTLA